MPRTPPPKEATAMPDPKPLPVSPDVPAPILFFERASAFGVHEGVVRITLDAMRIFPEPEGNGVLFDRVAVAHLRMSIGAAQSLRMALDRALLLAEPVQGRAKN